MCKWTWAEQEKPVNCSLSCLHVIEVLSSFAQAVVKIFVIFVKLMIIMKHIVFKRQFKMDYVPAGNVFFLILPLQESCWCSKQTSERFGVPKQDLFMLLYLSVYCIMWKTESLFLYRSTPLILTFCLCTLVYSDTKGYPGPPKNSNERSLLSTSTKAWNSCPLSDSIFSPNPSPLLSDGPLSV